MQFMPMPQMKPNNNQQQMASLLQAVMARGGRPSPMAAPVQPGAAMPGGAMNISPVAQQQPVGLLSGLLGRMRGAQPLDPNAPMAAPMTSETALY